jgi:hypothetical protein
VPSPTPEALRSLALTCLDKAYSAYHAFHHMQLLASGPMPNLDEEIVVQRRALLHLSSQMIEVEFNKLMDNAASCWKDYREATKP